MLPLEIRCHGIHMLQGIYVAMVLPRDTCSQWLRCHWIPVMGCYRKHI